jgi:hypothetical protein
MINHFSPYLRVGLLSARSAVKNRKAFSSQKNPTEMGASGFALFIKYGENGEWLNMAGNLIGRCRSLSAIWSHYRSKILNNGINITDLLSFFKFHNLVLKHHPMAESWHYDSVRTP